jgi:hypothetical protein
MKTTIPNNFEVILDEPGNPENHAGWLVEHPVNQHGIVDMTKEVSRQRQEFYSPLDAEKIGLDESVDHVMDDADAISPFGMAIEVPDVELVKDGA